jgi:hypothetical protein
MFLELSTQHFVKKLDLKSAFSANLRSLFQESKQRESQAVNFSLTEREFVLETG